jgi:hypothetical protein
MAELFSSALITPPTVQENQVDVDSLLRWNSTLGPCPADPSLLSLHSPRLDNGSPESTKRNLGSTKYSPLTGASTKMSRDQSDLKFAGDFMLHPTTRWVDVCGQTSSSVKTKVSPRRSGQVMLEYKFNTTTTTLALHRLIHQL